MPRFLLVVIILLLVSLAWTGTKQYQHNSQVLGTKIEQEIEIEKIKDSLVYWQEVASASPTYRDTYIQLAISYWQLAATGEAKQNLQRALELDPNWVVPPQLEALLLLLR